ncbi:biliverdin-producing heme oxygenase [Leucobacter weissii]|uniref:Biliverdin-producing heme oxygenase n=1 Tax=Leucobacter weissii TaxID=1983706 RepID=A0A939SBB2_9MICO|nr:biliverdin-producing heme oxygenase [Leucobacter weissii]MBO1901213.1 biliverdin-producing heme oxygenase [Leucobacter weissii]
MSEFDTAVVDAVAAHMNGDHPDDNLLIARAFGFPEAAASEMVGLDGGAGYWRVGDAAGEHELRVAWPGGRISERPEIRREVVSLYRSACEKLGVPPREEHREDRSAHGGEERTADEEPGSFSLALRSATWGDHGESEQATFMDDIMKGEADREDFAELVAQHYFLYRALEEAAQQLAADPAYAVFHPAELVRLPALEEDLESLLGPGWRDLARPVPATEAYAARIREIAAEGWKPGILAHHYTRYLGDLSGGQAIARLVARQHGLGRAGVAFYDFAALGPIPRFKERYREALDALGERLDADERQRVIDEVRTAYRFNTETFLDLDGVRAGKTPTTAA